MTVLVPQVHKASVLSRLHPGKLLTIVLPVLATLIFSLPLHAQETISVKGHVISDAGQPIPLASITVKGSSKGTNSNEKGDFELSVASNATLVVSSVGFLSREVAVNGQTSLTVRLAPSADLDQVVVVGYGTQRKKDVTGSVVSVNERALREVPEYF